MKRLAFIIALLLPVLANAQVRVLKEYDDEDIFSFKAGLAHIEIVNGDYRLILPANTKLLEFGMLFLGRDKESSAATLKDLRQLLATMTPINRVVIDSGYEEQVTLRRENLVGVSFLFLSFPNNTEACTMTEREMTRCIDFLEGKKITEEESTDEEDESRYR